MGWLSRLAHALVVSLESLCGWILGKSGDWVVNDPKFMLGLFSWGFVWAMYLCSETEDRYKIVADFILCAVLALGMDLMVLSMLQTMGAAGFFGLLILAGVNVYFTTIQFPCEVKEATDKPEGMFRAKNIYENVLISMNQVYMIFIGQTILLVFLVYSCYYNFEENHDKVTYSFWIAAYVSVQMSGFFKRGGDSQVGRPWDLEKWKGIEAHNESVEYLMPPSPIESHGKWVKRTPEDMKRRGMMGYMVNTFYRDIVMLITPILCMQSESAVDFVQNCFALSYITTIDDIGDPVEIQWQKRAQQVITQRQAEHGTKMKALFAVGGLVGRKVQEWGSLPQEAPRSVASSEDGGLRERFVPARSAGSSAASQSW